MAVVLTYSNSQKISQEQQMMAITRSAAVAIELKIDVIRSALEVLAASPAMQARDFETLYRTSQEIGKIHGGVIALTDRNGRIFNTRIPFGAIAPQPVQQIQEMMTLDSWHISDLFIAPTTGQFVFSVSMPIVVNGETAYAIWMILPAEVLTELLLSQNYPKGWLAGISDRGGVILARNINPTERVGQKAFAEFLTYTAERDEGVFTSTSLDGVTVKTSFVRIFDAWVVAVGVNQSLLDAPLDNSLTQIALGGTLVILLAGSLAFWRSNRIVASTKLLTAAAQALGRGEPLPSPGTFAFREASEVFAAEQAAERLLNERSAALQDLTVTLEKQVEERTRKLNEAMVTADRANRAKSEFLASMSHELSTPLNAIMGFAYLLKKQLSDERETMYVAHILGASEQLHQLIKDLLDLSRIESGQLRVSLETVWLPGVLERTAFTLNGLANENQVEIQIPDQGESWLVRADSSRLLQVFLNFGTNAIKYNKPNGRLSVEVTRPEPGWLRITFIDTGKGIPLDRQGEVFEAFNRLGAEKGKMDGAGIGLAISRNLTGLMGGRIGFESTPDIGSSFWIELPEIPTQSG